MNLSGRTRWQLHGFTHAPCQAQAAPCMRGVKFCTAKCGYSDPVLLNGRHFLPVRQSVLQHGSAQCGGFSTLANAPAGRLSCDFGKTADWVIGHPMKRPYDGCCIDAGSSAGQGVDVGVADPTRHHYLPCSRLSIFQTGTIGSKVCR